jgi:RNA polymerase sigma factor (sigma-70 family)
MTTLLESLNVRRTPPLYAREVRLEEVFRKHFQLIYETALHVTGNTYDADDVVQNTFLQFIARNQSLQIANPGGYFRRAAFRHALNIVRNRKRVDLTDDAERFDGPVEQGTECSQDKEQQLSRFVQNLKPSAALMIKLRYVEGLSNKQIAEFLGKSVPVVAMTLMRLRKRLKKMAEEER